MLEIDWEQVLQAVVLALILSLGYIIYRLYKCKKNKKIKHLVAEIVGSNDGMDIPQYRYGIPLWAYIKDAQLHCAVPEKYQINWDIDRGEVEKILDIFQSYLVQMFFLDAVFYKKVFTLALPSPRIEEKEFFFFQLFCFLSNCVDRKPSVRRYQWKISDNCDMCVFWKLYHVTYLACKSGVIYRNQIAGWLTSGHFTSEIDKRS